MVWFVRGRGVREAHPRTVTTQRIECAGVSKRRHSRGVRGVWRRPSKAYRHTLKKTDIEPQLLHIDDSGSTHTYTSVFHSTRHTNDAVSSMRYTYIPLDGLRPQENATHTGVSATRRGTGIGKRSRRAPSPRCEQRGGRRWSATPGATADTQNPQESVRPGTVYCQCGKGGKWAGTYVEDQVVERVANLCILAIVGVFEGKHKHQVRHGMESWNERVCAV